MLFNSFAFLLFFPAVVAVHFLLPARVRWLHQLIASYAFYMWWEPAYALLILASTGVDWAVALRMPTAAPTAKRTLLAVSLAVNLGLLFSFKYYNFVNAQFGELAGLIGLGWPLPESTWLLPVGISFYTFQTLGYTIDVYNGRQAPERHLGRFALYVSFWPQLVAGPIERAGHLLPQLASWAGWDSDRVATGLRRMLWGLFKKMVIADRCAPIVDAIYAEPQAYGGWAIVLGTVLFAYQIWCDFSGYTDVALGAAQVLGIELMENFDQPHLSASIRDYWRRWHLSLTAWIRTYLYFPLGGNRVGVSRHVLNIIVVFFICGLWHGAGWNFILWGLAHAVFIIAETYTQSFRDGIATAMRVPARIRQAVQVPVTWVLILITYSLFRSEGPTHWLRLVERLPQGWSSLGLTEWAEVASSASPGPMWLLVLLLALPVTELLQYARRDQRALLRWNELPFGVRMVGDLALLFAVLVLGETGAEAFFYFQF